MSANSNTKPGNEATPGAAGTPRLTLKALDDRLALLEHDFTAFLESLEETNPGELDASFDIAVDEPSELTLEEFIKDIIVALETALLGVRLQGAYDHAVYLRDKYLVEEEDE